MLLKWAVGPLSKMLDGRMEWSGYPLRLLCLEYACCWLESKCMNGWSSDAMLIGTQISKPSGNLFLLIPAKKRSPTQHSEDFSFHLTILLAHSSKNNEKPVKYTGGFYDFPCWLADLCLTLGVHPFVFARAGVCRIYFFCAFVCRNICFAYAPVRFVLLLHFLFLQKYIWIQLQVCIFLLYMCVLL